MNRIKKINVMATDNKTGSVVKLIETTAGDFYSKTLAYNQTFERYEKIMLQYGGSHFKAIPLTIKTLRYLTEPRIATTLTEMRILTRSRKERGQVYTREVDNIKKELLTSKNVVLYFLQVPEADWELISFEDLETFTTTLIEAGAPHVTIPLHAKESFVNNKEFFDRMKKKLKEDQDIVPQFNPKMKKREGEQVLQKIFSESRSQMTMIAGYTPNANHLFYYSYLWNHHPKGKLLIGAEVQDTFGDEEQKLPTHSALKRFGFDITCRKVTFPAGQGFDFPIPPDKNFIYDDNTGGLLAESDQQRWHGKSAVDVIMNNFPANTGLNFREYVLAYNFAQLNRTGFKEADSIMKNNHTDYISARPILQAYWNPE